MHDSINKERLNKKKITFGDAGYQSVWLLHAKSALCRLSYIPAILTRQNHKRPIINNSENENYPCSLCHK